MHTRGYTCAGTWCSLAVPRTHFWFTSAMMRTCFTLVDLAKLARNTYRPTQQYKFMMAKIMTQIFKTRRTFSNHHTCSSTQAHTRANNDTGNITFAMIFITDTEGTRALATPLISAILIIVFAITPSIIASFVHHHPRL